MIHTMPDKTVRVTSRFPNEQSTVYFDLTRAGGFTLEGDSYRPETFTLKILGGYTSSSAHYAGLVEAEADLADLNLMLADRHSVVAPSPASVSSPLAAAPCVRRKGWGWKGALAGRALGAGVSYLVTDIHCMETASRTSL